MPIARLETVKAWSYSRLSDYTKCPALAKFKHVLKLREPGNVAMDKGSRIHALAEVWVTRVLPADLRNLSSELLLELRQVILAKKIPEELFRFADEFNQLRKAKASGEGNWGFTRDWEPCSPIDWNRCWLRVKADTVYLKETKKGRKRETTVYIIDHKTGREYKEHAEQRALYALGALLMYPDAQAVVVAHWYLDAGKIGGPETWQAAQVDELKKEWTRKTTALLNDTTFAPNQGPHCAYCHFRKSNNGPCEMG